jgi:hypothetical protein
MTAVGRLATARCGGIVYTNVTTTRQDSQRVVRKQWRSKHADGRQREPAKRAEGGVCTEGTSVKRLPQLAGKGGREEGRGVT